MYDMNKSRCIVVVVVLVCVTDNMITSVADTDTSIPKHIFANGHQRNFGFAFLGPWILKIIKTSKNWAFPSENVGKIAHCDWSEMSIREASKK